MQAAAGGDAEAFETLVRTHLDAVYGHALRFFGDRADAEDAAQEVMVKLYRSLDKFDGRSSVSTWLFRITRNTCLDMFRAGRRRPVPMDPVSIPETSSEDSADAVCLADALDAALAKLPPEERDAFNAVTLFDLKYDQAAEALGVAAGTVKSRVHRARKALVMTMGLGER